MERSLDPTRQLVERHADYLRRLARALVHDEAAAQDVAQETWRVALEQRGERVEEPRAWLAGIARRVAWRRLRDDERRIGRERDAARSETEAEPDALDLGDALQAAMRRLDEPFRETVVLRYLHDLPPREIARRTGVPLGTVKSRLKRGLAALRVDLDRAHGGDRRAWALAFVSGFELTPPAVPVSVDPTPEAAHAGASTAAKTTLWTATVGMNIKLLTASALVVSASLWALNRDTGTTPDVQTVSSTVETDDLAVVEPTLDRVSPGTRRDELVADETESTPTAAARYSMSLEFEALDERGAPYADLAVQIAPPDHGFVHVGHTDLDGRLRTEWTANAESMVIEVAFVENREDISGVQRVQVDAGRTRRIEARLTRDRGSEYEIAERPVVGGARVRSTPRVIGVTEERNPPPVRISPMRYAPDNDEGRLAFASYRKAQDRVLGGVFLLSSVATVSSVSEGEMTRILTTVVYEEEVPEVDDRPAFVEGFVSDEFGRPAAHYPVRFTVPNRPGRPSNVMTDEDGHFRFQTTAGETVCSVGEREDRVEWKRVLDAGEVAAWSPKVRRANDLMLRLTNSEGHDVDGAIVQVRVDDGEQLWLARAVADKEGRVLIPGCPAKTVEVVILAPEKVAALPFVTISDVPTGSLWEHEIVESSLMALPVECSPQDALRPTRPAVEMLIFDETRTWGTRRRIPGPPGTPCKVTLPEGTFWLEVATHRSGRTEIGEVHVVGDQPIDLGRIELEPMGTLTLPALTGPGASIAVHHLRDDVETCVERRSFDEDGGEPTSGPSTVTLRPGSYRVTVTNEDGAARSEIVEVRLGETAVVSAGGER